ncbi:hypothetical protein Sgly_0465 [Syntrophobotulus glycolicus DSM 8271]|uniref:Uncharacterized protein n=1 Tax=Syntrophobotulus glycolicus (strain DSM 8271 / FlGlyR) TaxID=645991 RepID=F0SYM9_SYNGF|nr:hypothetical protein [Syntrophobotulus glycolicus]ADY54830.1 hypothetical protein Sgly_0465 [Syntrophobotulus glycolicus DSM 8271]
MEKEHLSKIRNKLAELASIVKSETTEGINEIKSDVNARINDMEAVIDERLDFIESKSKDIYDKTKDQALDKISNAQEKVEKNTQDLISDLEYKALKVQYTFQEKYSQGIIKKDAIVVKTADSLIDVINKAKSVLRSEEK